MGRPKSFREKVLAHVLSVSAKSRFAWLVAQNRERFGLSSAEAELLAQRADRFLVVTAAGPANEQVVVELPIRDCHRRGHRTGTVSVVLSLFNHDDLMLYQRDGLEALQNARLVRLIEEAYFQGAHFPLATLSLFTNRVAKANRQRLLPLWEAGVRLPVAGQSRRCREKMVFLRATYALQRYLAETPAEVVCRELWYSPVAWHNLTLDFVALGEFCRQGAALEDVARRLGLPFELAAEWLTLWQAAVKAGNPVLRRLGDRFGQELYRFPSPAGDSVRGFRDELRSWFGFSPAKAEAYLAMLESFPVTRRRKPGEVVYYAVAAEEPPGKPLHECQLVPVCLPLYEPEDAQYVTADAVMALKWAKLLRLSTAAKAQGACLNQADIAFLLGVEVGVIQRLMQANPKVVLPLRGNVMDIGPGLTHVRQIISLYLQGYTETEIKHRTSHSYESIEEYVRAFSTVVTLADRGMPAPLIRQAMRCSAKLVETHLALYREYNRPEYAWRLELIRNVFHRTEAAKKNRLR